MADEQDSLPVGADLQAVFCNSFYVYVGAETTRVILGDMVDGHVEYENALVMPTSKARELAEAILALMRQAEETKRRAH